MSPRPTITEVAAACGVSVATVSKAVNGRHGVATATIDRVMQAVHELGYESSLLNSGLRGRRTGMIGVLVADFEPFSTEVLKGVAAGRLPFELLAYSGAREGDADGWERRSLSRLGGALLDGAILVAPTVLDVSADVPIVAIDPHTGPTGVPTVESDSFGGAREAVRHLIGLGHTRIAHLAGRPDLRSSLAREAGYRHALADAGLPVDPMLISDGRYTADIARRAAAALLSIPDRPTAVFAANDLSALALLEVASAHGVRVPDDLSIIGFDDIPDAAHARPPLSTVRQDMHELGIRAAGMIMALMRGVTPSESHVRLPTRLVLRATTAPPARDRAA